MASNGPLTAVEALKRQDDKTQKSKEAQERSANYKARVALNKVKRELHSRGVLARKAEQARK